ncbi:hypothetical protein VTK26DRAFT_6775 [Humicola hyalothermophila]
MRLLAVFVAAGLALASSLPPLSTRATTFTNPVLWEDLPDIDVFRVGNVFYYSSSTFAYSPGAPVLKSYDLVNWEYASHSVPTLEFSSNYNLTSATNRAYVKGIWASTLRYRESNDMFYWVGCVDGSTYVYTSAGSGAADNNGEATSWNWKQSAVLRNKCYYDCGLLIDDDDTMYVVYGMRQIYVAQLSADGLGEVRSELVYDSGSTYLEGAHMYKINGYYWIVPTIVASGEWVLRSRSPWGPYEARVLFDGLAGPLPNAGYAHQGGMVETAAGDWWYMAFLDAYPGGRIPVLAPLTWTADGWPQLVTDDDGRWGSSYPFPVQTSSSSSSNNNNNNGTSSPSTKETDAFLGPALGHEWEWNHNPDASKWRFATDAGGGLVLETATVTDDLYTARNTLTRRVRGPRSVATFALDVSRMREGDRAGVALFRSTAAYVGVHRSSSGEAQLVVVDGLALDEASGWATASKGEVRATGPVVEVGSSGGLVYLRVEADITPAFGLNPVREARFSYSLDGGREFVQLGQPWLLRNEWQFFSGYRFAVFNFATQQLGGQITVKSFDISTEAGS